MSVSGSNTPLRDRGPMRHDKGPDKKSSSAASPEISELRQKYAKYIFADYVLFYQMTSARLAQSVERKALNLVVVGSSPTVGAAALCLCFRAVGICHLNQAGLSLMWSVQLQGH